MTISKYGDIEVQVQEDDRGLFIRRHEDEFWVGISMPVGSSQYLADLMRDVYASGQRAYVEAGAGGGHASYILDHAYYPDTYIVVCRSCHVYDESDALVVCAKIIGTVKGRSLADKLVRDHLLATVGVA